MNKGLYNIENIFLKVLVKHKVIIILCSIITDLILIGEGVGESS